MSGADRWRDQPDGYGAISRALHWGMAILFAWQFTSALLHLLAADTAVEEMFWRTHYSVGFTLWCLVLVRGAWGLANLARRPRHEGPPLLNHAANAGHLALYTLMTIVPSLALLRAIGSERGLRLYGMQILAPGVETNPVLTAPANVAQGLLGYTLLLLIAGHIAMALWHGLVRGDTTLDHMVRGHGQALRRLRGDQL